MTTKPNKKKKYRIRHHRFYFSIAGNKPLSCKAKVINAKTPVTLRLTAEDVRKSMSLNGVGNTQTCSMAVCAKRQEEAFPHLVEGYIDWFYSRAYVVTKLDKSGLPSECVVYRHHDSIAKLNDTKGGQKQLLADLEAGGDRYIALLPIKATSSGPSGKSTGTGRTRRPKLSNYSGAQLRFAVAQLGGVG